MQLYESERSIREQLSTLNKVRTLCARPYPSIHFMLWSALFIHVTGVVCAQRGAGRGGNRKDERPRRGQDGAAGGALVEHARAAPSDRDGKGARPLRGEGTGKGMGRSRGNESLQQLSGDGDKGKGASSRDQENPRSRPDGNQTDRKSNQRTNAVPPSAAAGHARAAGGGNTRATPQGDGGRGGATASAVTAKKAAQAAAASTSQTSRKSAAPVGAESDSQMSRCLV